MDKLWYGILTDAPGFEVVMYGPRSESLPYIKEACEELSREDSEHFYIPVATIGRDESTYALI